MGFEESHALEIHNKGRLEGVRKILEGWQHNFYCIEMLQLSRLLFGVGKIWWWVLRFHCYTGGPRRKRGGTVAFLSCERSTGLQSIGRAGPLVGARFS